MTQDDLRSLTRENLIDLVLAQAHQIEALQKDIEALRFKLEQSQKPKPPTNSQNSSQPPSQDRKGKRSKEQGHKRHGPPKGHAQHVRPMISQPDHVVEVKAQTCPRCEQPLEPGDEQLVLVNQITELPEAKAEVIEVRQYARTCAHCQETVVAQPPVGLEPQRSFGPRLEATVVYYRQEQHLSYQRTQAALLNLHGVPLSQGGIDDIMQQAGQKALEQKPVIQKAIQASPVIHSDETGNRVGGDNWWEWVFCSTQAVLHVSRDNRSVDVIREVMDQAEAEVWVSDAHPGQLKAPAKARQLCLAHQLRNLQAVVEAYPELRWPRAMQVVFRAAIHLHHQREELTPQKFAARVARLEHFLDRLLAQELGPPDAARLQRRYLKHRQSLFVFLYRTDVEPTNNVAERALRASVIHRKVTGGFRSQWGADAYAALASVIDTAELKGIQAFQAIQSLFGRPLLPIPIGGE
jgi:transposase